MLKAYKIGTDGFFDGEIEIQPTDPLMRNYTLTAPPEGKTVKWEHSEWVEAVKVPPSTPFVNIEGKFEELRKERNRLLSASDWTQISDVPLTEEKKQEWISYRQLLRDLFNGNPNPFYIFFPEEPK